MKLIKRDIISIIGAISAQCSDAFNFNKKEDMELVCELWYDSLKEYPKEIVMKAVKNALKNSDFQKRNWLGAICQEIEKMKSSTEKGGAELWEDLTDTFYKVCIFASMLMNTFKEDDGVRQCDKASAKLKELFNSLDNEIREYIRSTSMLIQLARSDSEQLSIEKGRFLKALPQIRERNKTLNAMPQEMRLFFSELTQQVKSNNEVPKLTDKK